MLKSFQFYKQTAPRKKEWLKTQFKDLSISPTDVTGI